MPANPIETAVRCKLRFTTAKGLVTTEDLWDINLETLNEIAKDLSRTVRENSVEDFIKKHRTKNPLSELELKLAAVLHVLNIKVEEQDIRENAAAKRLELNRLTTALAAKENEQLNSLSPDELKAKIAALSGSS